VKRSVLCAAVLASIAAAGLTPAAFAADDTSLTWNGVTLYGAVDVGIAYQSHGAPLSQDFYPGLEYLVQKNSNKSITSVAPNGLSQSRIGLKGSEPINDQLAAVFNVEMGFLPTSGHLADAPKSLINNNGIALSEQKTAGDGSRAGQFFNGTAYAGLSGQSWGTFTLGRQNSLGLDNVIKYDPMNASYALSIIGYSGVAGAIGSTEDARLDDTVKYVFKYDTFHFGVLYQFKNTDSQPGEAWQADAGFDYGGFSVDAAYSDKKDAITAASLSAAQLAPPAPALPPPRDSLAATISDNTGYQIAGSYAGGAWKAYGGYERVTYSNPSTPVSAGFSGLGGYYISITNNAAFPHDKNLDIGWLGVKYAFGSSDLTGAWYHLSQNGYGATKCSDASAGNCSGDENVYSLRYDYHFTKRFDMYAGAAWSKVSDGLAAGFLHTSVFSPIIGARFQF